MDAPSPEMLRAVRASFVQQGTSFAKWCEEHGIVRQYAGAVLLGKRNGPAAKALRRRLLTAAKLERSAA
jgi:hypothetical protein